MEPLALSGDLGLGGEGGKGSLDGDCYYYGFMLGDSY